MVSAAKIGTFLDANCSVPITNLLAFTDVCTWSADSYNGAFAVSASDCSTEGLTVSIYNATQYPTCQGPSVFQFPVTQSCEKVQDFYVIAFNTSCLSLNTTYNILAHFVEDCTDGGLPFSIQLGEQGCQGGSFGPSFLSYDTQGIYADPYYLMSVFNTTDGSCKEQKALYATKSFPAMCLQPVENSLNISLDIYNAFPL